MAGLFWCTWLGVEEELFSFELFVKFVDDKKHTFPWSMVLFFRIGELCLLSPRSVLAGKAGALSRLLVYSFGSWRCLLFAKRFRNLTDSHILHTMMALRISITQ